MSRRGDHHCPYCGQRMLVRHGAKLTPKQADMFDMIDRVTKAGGRVALETLADVFYPDRSRERGKFIAKAHVWRLNERLAETDLVIRAAHRSGYRLEKRKRVES